MSRSGSSTGPADGVQDMWTSQSVRLVPTVYSASSSFTLRDAKRSGCPGVVPPGLRRRLLVRLFCCGDRSESARESAHDAVCAIAQGPPGPRGAPWRRPFLEKRNPGFGGKRRAGAGSARQVASCCMGRGGFWMKVAVPEMPQRCPRDARDRCLLHRGAGCVNRARPDLREPRVSNHPWPPSLLFPSPESGPSPTGC